MYLGQGFEYFYYFTTYPKEFPRNWPPKENFFGNLQTRCFFFGKLFIYSDNIEVFIYSIKVTKIKYN